MDHQIPPQPGSTRKIKRRGPLRSTPFSLTEADASSYLGLSRPWLRAMRQKKRGPAFYRIGRAIRYRLPDLDGYLQAHRVSSDGQVRG